MGRALTNEEVKNFYALKGIRLRSEYLGNRRPFDLECLNCGYSWTVKEKSNKGCYKCGKKVMGAKLRLTDAEVHAGFMSRGIRLNGPYQGVNAPCDVECLVCGRKWQGSYHQIVTTKTDCRNCAIKKMGCAELGIRLIEISYLIKDSVLKSFIEKKIHELP